MMKIKNSTHQLARFDSLFNSIDTIPTIKQVASAFLPRVADEGFNPAFVAEIIQADPSLTIKTLQLAARSGNIQNETDINTLRILSSLDSAQVRTALLSIPVVNLSEQKDADLSLLGLYKHSIASACAAKMVAEITLPREYHQTAFTAGLLLDIGKFAVLELVPKSLAKINGTARSKNLDIAQCLSQNLGFDHAIIGKRLAQKWQLPEIITNSIWLQHNDFTLLDNVFDHSKFFAAVRLGWLLAARASIGESLDYRQEKDTSSLASLLELSEAQLNSISAKIKNSANEKFSTLGLNNLDFDSQTSYINSLQNAVNSLWKENQKLKSQSDNLKTPSAIAEFTSRLTDLNPSAGLTETAKFCIQKFTNYFAYPPAIICICQGAKKPVIAVTIDNDQQIRPYFLQHPQNECVYEFELAENKVNPEKLFAPLNNNNTAEIYNRFQWLFDEINITIDYSNIKLLPFGKTPNRGAIIYNQYYAAPKINEQNLETLGKIISHTINTAATSENQNRLAEKISSALARSSNNTASQANQKAIESLAELAAGAAHELNNPLAVISGRVQLLLDSEKNENNINVLKLISENTNRASEIISDLMFFAKPKQPTTVLVSIINLIENATKTIAAKHPELDLKPLTKDALGSLPEVYIDIHQTSRAVANVIINALQAVADSSSPSVIITGKCKQENAMAIFQVTDNGNGMDKNTLNKAFVPFFSNRKAGRATGMGLAHAKRLIEINHGEIKIDSIPAKGTTVTISLPACIE
jgi:signal transduction histidine kinase/HD-like signal output (HDOD) protein